MMKRVFISYSRKDEAFARRLTRALEDVGADVWVDFDDIPAGDKWSTAIQDGLDSSEGMLVILSPDSMASPNVEDEWQYFMDHGNPVIPIMFRATNVHFQLHRLQHVNFYERDFGESFANLLDELESKGVSLKFDAVEETVKFPTARKSDKPKRPAPIKPAQSSRLPIPLIAAGTLVTAVVLAALIWFSLPDDTSPINDANEIDDTPIAIVNEKEFDPAPIPFVFETNAWIVHVDVGDDETLSFDNTILWSRFFEDGQQWYEIEDIDKDEMGYQVLENIPSDQPELLILIPLEVDIADDSIEVYQTASEASTMRLLEVEDTVLLFGFLHDENGQLWQYVTILVDEVVTGWTTDDEGALSNVYPVAPVAYTNRDVEALWYYDDSDDIASTIPNDTLVRIVTSVDDFYGIGYYMDGWELLFVPKSSLDISDTSEFFIP